MTSSIGILHRTDPAPARHLRLVRLTSQDRRQRAVEALGLGEEPRSERFDRITRIARTLVGARMSAVTVLDGDTACFLGAAGHAGDPVPREQTFCSTTTRLDTLLVVPDARRDQRFEHLHAVRTGEVRFYAGAPLHDARGEVVGVLCVFDPDPATLDGARRQSLLDLAAVAEEELLASGEMAAAARIQDALLPPRPLRLPGWEVAGTCLPASAVGGDFFDHGVVDGVLHLGLGDAMGTGTGAALVSAEVRAALRAARAEVASGVDAGTSIAHVARSLGQDLERSGSFAALAEAAVDLQDGRVRFVDAGLGLVLVVRADGTVERHVGHDRPLGVLPDDRWSERRTSLEPGDRLVMFSDGLLGLLDDPLHWWLPMGRLVAQHEHPEALMAAIAELAAARSPLDDVTALVVHRRPRRSVGRVEGGLR